MLQLMLICATSFNAVIVEHNAKEHFKEVWFGLNNQHLPDVARKTMRWSLRETFGERNI